MRPDGRWFRVLRRRVAGGGTVTVMTETPRRSRPITTLADARTQLQVALNNMPGALVYTDANLDVVVCNNRFKDLYIVPQELLQPGCPYPAFLRYLAEHGYYGPGDIDALVA